MSKNNISHIIAQTPDINRKMVTCAYSFLLANNALNLFLQLTQYQIACLEQYVEYTLQNKSLEHDP